MARVLHLLMARQQVSAKSKLRSDAFALMGLHKVVQNSFLSVHATTYGRCSHMSYLSIGMFHYIFSSDI